MNLRMALLGALAAALLAGCATGRGGTNAGAAPRAVTPVTRYDFGDVPVTTDMNDARLKQFVIQNQGGANLELGVPEVRLLDGC